MESIIFIQVEQWTPLERVIISLLNQIWFVFVLGGTIFECMAETRAWCRKCFPCKKCSIRLMLSIKLLLIWIKLGIDLGIWIYNNFKKLMCKILSIENIVIACTHIHAHTRTHACTHAQTHILTHHTQAPIHTSILTIRKRNLHSLKFKKCISDVRAAYLTFSHCYYKVIMLWLDQVAFNNWLKVLTVQKTHVLSWVYFVGYIM